MRLALSESPAPARSATLCRHRSQARAGRSESKKPYKSCCKIFLQRQVAEPVNIFTHTSKQTNHICPKQTLARKVKVIWGVFPKYLDIISTRIQTKVTLAAFDLACECEYFQVIGGDLKCDGFCSSRYTP
jgi:hypothetical protein